MSDSLASRVCPICGVKTDKLFEGLCLNCFRKVHPLAEIPEKIQVTLCKICGSYRIGGKWVKPKGDNPLFEATEAVVRRETKLRWRTTSLLVTHVEGGRVEIVARGSAREEVEPYEEEYTSFLRTRWELCDECKLAKSKREAARVQVRAKNRKLLRSEVEKIKKTLEESLSERNRGGLDLIDIIEEGQVLDLVFSSFASARLVVNALKKKFLASLLETHKISGITSSGKKLSKLTVRLLLPEFKPGDIIEYDGKLYYILSMSEEGVRVFNLNSMAELKVEGSRALIERSKVVCKREDLVQVIVASTKGGYVVVTLDNYSTLSLPYQIAPFRFKEEEQAFLANINGQYYLLPIVE
ncbi:MAG: NMD3-related protein [Thermofilaceae archaeon]|nr:NMD3-related protein [Thermofilaceae archaeon]MCX8180192.1 NMD3-related protein [Thermofilaceae archaeon]MDW8004152.1 NMD3-related protein [Thermofilaceae archaeon]